MLYRDLLGRGPGLSSPNGLSVQGMWRALPSLAPCSLSGGGAQTDSTRVSRGEPGERFRVWAKGESDSHLSSWALGHARIETSILGMFWSAGHHVAVARRASGLVLSDNFRARRCVELWIPLRSQGLIIRLGPNTQPPHQPASPMALELEG